MNDKYTGRFPFFYIAKKYGVNYGKVLKLVERMESEYPILWSFGYYINIDYVSDTFNAVLDERYRRRRINKLCGNEVDKFWMDRD